MFLSFRSRAFGCAVLLAIVAPHGTTALGECGHVGIDAAIAAAVRARMGADAAVTLGECRVRGLATVPASSAASPERLTAVPDVGARTGGFVRFLVFDGVAPDGVAPRGLITRGAAPRGVAGPGLAPAGSTPVRAAPAGVATGVGAPARTLARRVGSVDVELHVTVSHMRARRNLTPRALIGREDVEEATSDVGRMPLVTLPGPDAIVGARVLRPIPPGRPIVASMLSVVPLVRSGDEVRTIVRVGALDARGTAIAAQTGTLGEEIRVVNADRRRHLKARVIGAGEVEVIQEH